jgi:hypothetical protein
MSQFLSVLAFGKKCQILKCLQFIVDFAQIYNFKKLHISSGNPKEKYAHQIVEAGTLSNKNRGSKKYIFAMANLQNHMHLFF